MWSRLSVGVFLGPDDFWLLNGGQGVLSVYFGAQWRDWRASLVRAEATAFDFIALIRWGDETGLGSGRH